MIRPFLAVAASALLVAIMVPPQRALASHDSFRYKWPWFPDINVVFTTLPDEPPHEGVLAYDIDYFSPVAIASSTQGSAIAVDQQPECDPLGGFGNRLTVSVEDGNVLTYAHLAPNMPFPYPAPFLQGDYVGDEGRTGNSINPFTGQCVAHLHWQFSSFIPARIDDFVTSDVCNLCPGPPSTNESIGGLVSTPGVAIRAEYNSEGGWGSVGWVADAGRGLPMHRYGAAWEQTFRNHDGFGGIYVPDSLITDSFWVEPDFWGVWQFLGGEALIGYPVSDKVAPCPQGAPPGCQYYQRFERGYIWSSGGTPQVVTPGRYIITTTPAYRRLNFSDNAWVAKNGAPPTTSGNRLRYFGGGLMFHATNNGNSDGQGSLRRSIDYGETWETLPPPSGADQVIDICQAPSGRLWALWADNSVGTLYTLKVYYSDDARSSWTHSLTHTTDRKGYFIACHPTNSNLIAFSVAGNLGNNTISVRVSQDGGVTWGPVGTTLSSDQTTTNRGGLAWTPSNRLIIYRISVGATDIFVSDNFGINWTLKVHKAVTNFWGQLIRGGTNGPYFVSKFATSDDFGVYRSNDHGDTWDEFLVPGAGTLDEVDYAHSLAYDPLTDTLYLGSRDENNVYRLRNASTVSPGSAIWELLPSPPGDIGGHHNLVLIND